MPCSSDTKVQTADRRWTGDTAFSLSFWMKSTFMDFLQNFLGFLNRSTWPDGTFQGMFSEREEIAVLCSVALYFTWNAGAYVSYYLFYSRLWCYYGGSKCSIFIFFVPIKIINTYKMYNVQIFLYVVCNLRKILYCMKSRIIKYLIDFSWHVFIVTLRLMNFQFLSLIMTMPLQPATDICTICEACCRDCNRF